MLSTAPRTEAVPSSPDPSSGEPFVRSFEDYQNSQPDVSNSITPTVQLVAAINASFKELERKCDQDRRDRAMVEELSKKAAPIQIRTYEVG
jgi:hypothetical protein